MGHKFEKFCKSPENIENYEKAKADNFKGWDCHHRLETHNSDGKRRDVDISVEELISIGMYFDRPAYELVFLPSSEHISLHKKGKTYFKGKHHTEEAKKKISEAQKGENNSMHGKSPWNKGKKMSEEYCRKNSESHKGKPSPNKGKHLSAEIKNKISDTLKGKPNATKGRHWYNNGIKNIMSKECPPGFMPGMLNK